MMFQDLVVVMLTLLEYITLIFWLIDRKILRQERDKALAYQTRLSSLNFQEGELERLAQDTGAVRG